jgi:5-methylcytosine-specific restriction protein A
MVTILTKGNSPAPSALSAKGQLLLAAWAYGLKAGESIHRLSLCAFVQSHLSNKSEPSLQRTIESDTVNWMSMGDGIYRLTEQGFKGLAKYGQQNFKIPLGSSFTFSKEATPYTFSVTIDPKSRKYIAKQNGIITKSEYIVENIHDVTTDTINTRQTSLPREIMSWILKDNKYSWQIDDVSALEKVEQNDAETTKPNTYLFVWNPKNWGWDYIERSIAEIDAKGKTVERWSCGNTRIIKPNDRIFLVKVGTEPKGIVASGTVISFPFLDKHWEDASKEIHCVNLALDILLNPDKEPILTIDSLREKGFTEQNWTPQASGISIRPELVKQVEEAWFEFLTTQQTRQNPITQPADMEQALFEGTKSQVLQTRYERNSFARRKCLDHYGYSCSVCEMSFTGIYGHLGKEFIHVHHLTSVAAQGQTYKVDPIVDLRPVCPNCHAMLHKSNPPYPIEKLKEIIAEVAAFRASKN